MAILVGTQLCRVDYATQRSWEKPRDSSTSNKSDQYGERANATSTESGGGVEGAANGVHWKHDNKTRDMKWFARYFTIFKCKSNCFIFSIKIRQRWTSTRRVVSGNLDYI